ncbi:MAG: hypothetical protein KDN22_21230 [Verrucomicrobiae bacterium]|nr:hypothetical protein [Verrucomicrobiae bacterium]
MRNVFTLFLLPLSLVLASCTTLPRPAVEQPSMSDPVAVQLLVESSKQSGDPWQNLERVEVAYDGEWSRFAEKTQPVLVDSGYRKTSTETYTPPLAKVVQVHRGTEGEKRVVRSPGKITVLRNGQLAKDEEEIGAAGLVADAYTIFTFGSSVLRDRGNGWRVIGQRVLKENGERCTLVSGTIRPGLGTSDADGIIAWIGNETKRLYRVQFTLNGLASTVGADVDVTFADFQPGTYGTEWPRHFVERVRRPLDVKAHEWRMTALKVVR